jgi:hypothetical protein
VSDNGAPSRAPRNSKSHVAKPSQLGFYSGPWVDVLIYARNGYRKLIHTKEPFPERNLENLKVAQNTLLEAISEYMETDGRLDESLYLFFSFWKFTDEDIDIYNDNCSGMVSLVRDL